MFSTTTLDLVPQLLKSYYILSHHVLSHLTTNYHTISPMFIRKIFLVKTLKLVPKSLKVVISYKVYHPLSHIVTPYPLCSTEIFFNDNSIFNAQTPKKVTEIITAYHYLSHLITP